MHDVSVVIPTCNRAHCLPRALDSVLAQTRQVREICVVDDGSSDGTEQLVRSRYPGVRYLRQANRGVSAARNLGIAKTDGEWIAFLDSDDEWLPDKIEKQFQALARRPGHSIIHCDEIWIRGGVRVNPMNKHAKSGGRIFEKCLPRCVISPSAVVIRRELLAVTGTFDESLPVCEDYDLWLRICSRFPVLYVAEKLLRKYGGHAGQLSRQYWGMDRYRVAALQRILQDGTLDPDQARAARRTLLDKCRILAGGAAKRGNQALLGEINTVLAGHRG